MRRKKKTTPETLISNATVSRVIYRNHDNGFTVLSLKVGVEELTATCNLPFTIDEGQEIEFEGEICFNPKYGKQIKASRIDIHDPTTSGGIKAYLASGILTGIGPVTAERIVNVFGEKSLEILDNSPERLLEVKGIGEKTLQKIASSWKEKREGARIVAELCRIGISFTYALKIYKKYGSSSIHVIEENPYKLADDVLGIGFKKADEIAIKFGFAKNHSFRIEAGVVYTLKEAQINGHCYLPADKLKDKAKEILVCESDLIENAIDMLLFHDKITAVKKVGDEAGTFYYLSSTYKTERYVEKRLKDLTSNVKPLGRVNFDKTFFTEEQLNAAQIAVTNGLSVITGAAGTGKTTVLKAIIKYLEENRMVYSLCAPTGKASKRITEVTKREARTIHRLIGFNEAIMGRRDERNPLDCDFVIVDEPSMVDLFLFADLLKAIPENGRLILIGDPNQLPPVGAGLVFKDLIQSGACPVAMLTKIQRQKERSNIIEVANQINNGVVPYIPNAGETYFFNINEPEKIADKIVELVTEKVPQKFGIAIENIQVLAPMKRGAIGVDNLNRVLQEKILPKETLSLKQFKLKDKVMQIVNDYDKGVFNGDIGYVASINTEEKSLTVNFDGLTVEYSYSDLDELILAYCCTVHKYQGSEAECVIIPVHQSHYIMLKRDLFYTAVTRARQMLILLGTKKAIAIAVKNISEQKRYTGLFKVA